MGPGAKRKGVIREQNYSFVTIKASYVLRLGANTSSHWAYHIADQVCHGTSWAIWANKEKNNVSAQVQFKHKLLVVSYHSSWHDVKLISSVVNNTVIRTYEKSLVRYTNHTNLRLIPLRAFCAIKPIFNFGAPKSLQPNFVIDVLK